MESVRTSDSFCTDNLSSAESCLQIFQNPDQFSMMASSFTPDAGIQANGFHPFDPFCNGSSSDFSLRESKTYEENGSVDPPLLYLQGGEFSLSPDRKDSLMESPYVLADDLGCHEDGTKRSRNSIQSNVNNESGSLSINMCSGGPKKPRSAKGQWTAEEDRLLIQLVEKYGLKRWTTIAHMLKGRAGKQCRERWHNHLRPDVKKDGWTEEEDRILVDLHQQVGNRWTVIAKSLPGRTENSIKNHWFGAIRMLSSKRRYSTRCPKPSLTLLNYINGLHFENESNYKWQNIQPPPTPVNALQDPGIGICPNDGMLPDYEMDAILKFVFHDDDASNVHNLESCLNDDTLFHVPPESNNIPWFNAELPVGMPPLVHSEVNDGHGAFQYAEMPVDMPPLLQSEVNNGHGSFQWNV